eukprot:TRINITY_DN4658_c2_g1_i1.p1 TRINITY_DN4658_c2_g1~~TRINITY_DN4658_c2_g1_i1.p1  ORF type:complete len:127 (+),score=6.03 TRINITY_DN4658_c2_g1_i1:204-584(+)
MSFEVFLLICPFFFYHWRLRFFLCFLAFKIDENQFLRIVMEFFICFVFFLAFWTCFIVKNWFSELFLRIGDMEFFFFEKSWLFERFCSIFHVRIQFLCIFMSIFSDHFLFLWDWVFFIFNLRETID